MLFLEVLPEFASKLLKQDKKAMYEALSFNENISQFLDILVSIISINLFIVHQSKVMLGNRCLTIVVYSTTNQRAVMERKCVHQLVLAVENVRYRKTVNYFIYFSKQNVILSFFPR